jgi:large subunit ribosomal protein L1
VIIGKASFASDALEANFRAILDELVKAKPSSAKGKYIRKATLSSTMGPGVQLDVAQLES